MTRCQFPQSFVDCADTKGSAARARAHTHTHTHTRARARTPREVKSHSPTSHPSSGLDGGGAFLHHRLGPRAPQVLQELLAGPCGHGRWAEAPLTLEGGWVLETGDQVGGKGRAAARGNTGRRHPFPRGSGATGRPGHLCLRMMPVSVASPVKSSWAWGLRVWTSGEWGCTRGDVLWVQAPPSAGYFLLSSFSL